MKKIFLLVILFMLFVYFSVSAQSAGKQLTHQLSEVFKQKSTTSIKENLSPNFSIGAYSNRSALSIFQSLSERYACDSVVLKKESSSKIEVLIYPTGKPALASAIYTDKDNKILYIDLFRSAIWHEQVQTFEATR
jgi:methionine-rich copper-binding protein CopC